MGGQPNVYICLRGVGSWSVQCLYRLFLILYLKESINVINLMLILKLMRLYLTLFQLRGAILAPDNLKQSLISTVL